MPIDLPEQSAATRVMEALGAGLALFAGWLKFHGARETSANDVARRVQLELSNFQSSYEVDLASMNRRVLQIEDSVRQGKREMLSALEEIRLIHQDSTDRTGNAINRLQRSINQFLAGDQQPPGNAANMNSKL